MKNFNSVPTEESFTVKINSLAVQKKQQGIIVYNLSAGEPKINCHPIIKKAAISAINKNKTLYPPSTGIGSLKVAAVNFMNRSFGSNFTTENVLVVNGGKFGLYLLLQFLLENNDEVLVPSPYWVSYPSITKLFGGTVKFIKTSAKTNWKIASEGIKKACKKNTKILILNNACNPTGVLYSKQELENILQVAEQKKLLVISDEVYSGLVYNKNEFVSCASFKKYQDRVVIIQSCSKNFAMTGWRIGFVMAPKKLIKNVSALVGQSTSGVTTISQWAAVAALENYFAVIKYVKEKMQKRRNLMAQLLTKELGIKKSLPDSSLYFFISLKDLGINNLSSTEFCKKALEKFNVAIVPGSAFGQEGYIRLSFGAEEKEIIDGVKALARCVKSL